MAGELVAGLVVGVGEADGFPEGVVVEGGDAGARQASLKPGGSQVVVVEVFDQAETVPGGDQAAGAVEEVFAVGPLGGGGEASGHRPSRG